MLGFSATISTSLQGGNFKIKNSENKTRRITVRLPAKVLQDLKKESEEKVLPLSSIISRILCNYVIFDAKKNTIPTITMSQILLSKLFKHLTENEKAELAKQGPKTVKKLFAMLNLEFTIPSVIENYFIIVGRYCDWYIFNYYLKNDHYRLVFKSDLGEEWIEFLSIYLRNILRSLKIRINKEIIDDSVIVFEFAKQTTHDYT